MRALFLSALVLSALSLNAQTPQPRLTYDDKSGTTGHLLTVDGKTLGPYQDITDVAYSTSGTAGIFLTTKRDKTYIVAQGKEWGPLAPGFEAESYSIADDGKVAYATLTKYDEEEDSTEVQLWVNGKTYGPFNEINTFEYAETGGNWIALVGQGEDQYSVILNGKVIGPYSYIEAVWMSPDGRNWGYVVHDNDEDGNISVYTSEKKYEHVSSGYFYQMNPRNAHWAYSVRLGDEDELIVVDGKEYRGYLRFDGLVTTASSRHWGFAAEKMTPDGDFSVVVIDGKEYVGENLTTSSLGAQEFFSWVIISGSKVTVQVLALP